MSPIIKVAAICLSIGALSATATAQQTRFTIGTGPQGSLYNTVGSGLAATFQDELGRRSTVQPSTGASVYIPLIVLGEVTMGLNSSIDLGAWYRGEYDQEPYDELRVLARMWPLRQALTVRADSGMTEVNDLVGQRVVTEMTSQAATGRSNVATLLAGGVELDEVEQITVAGLGQGMNGLVENTLDATGVAVGIPLTQQAHATIPGGIRYLSVTGDNATDEFIDNVFPGVYLVEIEPAERMPEITEAFTGIGYDVYLTVSANLSDEDANAILTAIWDNLPQLVQDYPAMTGASRELMADTTNTVPYHDAAIDFFEEKGLWTEGNTEKQQQLLSD